MTRKPLQWLTVIGSPVCCCHGASGQPSMLLSFQHDEKTVTVIDSHWLADLLLPWWQRTSVNVVNISTWRENRYSDQQSLARRSVVAMVIADSRQCCSHFNMTRKLLLWLTVIGSPICCCHGDSGQPSILLTFQHDEKTVTVIDSHCLAGLLLPWW